jgi:transcriptional regulator GlxA family with amidase domain
MNVGILIFHEVLELDVAAVMAVFAAAAGSLPKSATEETVAPALQLEVFTLAKTRGSVRGSSGLIMTPTYAFAGVPKPDVLFVPGGVGAQKIAKDVQTKEYLRTEGAGVQNLVSVGAGALVLGEADLLTDLDTVTTPNLAQTLWKYNPGNVLEAQTATNPNGRQFAASSLAGMDLALEIVRLEFGEDIWAKTKASLGR